MMANGVQVQISVGSFHRCCGQGIHSVCEGCILFFYFHGELDVTGTISVFTADKDSTSNAMEYEDYDRKICTLLDEHTYQKLPHDPTSRIMRKTSELHKHFSEEDNVVKNLLPQAPRPPTAHVLPKIYKDGTPFHLIVPTISSESYNTLAISLLHM